MAARKGVSAATTRPKSLGKFSEDTLAILVDDALARIETMRADLSTEGMVVDHEVKGEIPNPKLLILQAEREWVRKAWSTKYQGKTDGKEGYFRRGADSEGA